MLRKILGFGCLTLIVAIGLFVYLLSQTELGQWAAGLLFVYGGAMLGGAIAHDTVPGTVTEINRMENPSAIAAGSLRFRYIDHEGVEEEEYRRVMYSTSKFRELEVGDEIRVWVCKDDPSIIKLVGYGTHEPESCGKVGAGE